MKIKYLDNHAHLNSSGFDVDRSEAIKRAQDAGIGVINVGTQKQDSELAVKIAEENENMWAIIGLHPTDSEEDFDYEFFSQLAKSKKVVGVGECGLDYFRLENLDKEKQVKNFEAQIEFAKENNLPLMLHVREAYQDALSILKGHKDIKGNSHFFAGTINEARQFLDLGFTLSFTGASTFPDKENRPNIYKELIEFVPLDRILSETDCPFVAPIPYRGKRNEPAYVVEVVKKIAEIKNKSLEEVRKQLLSNSKNIFNLR